MSGGGGGGGGGGGFTILNKIITILLHVTFYIFLFDREIGWY